MKSRKVRVRKAKTHLPATEICNHFVNVLNVNTNTLVCDHCKCELVHFGADKIHEIILNDNRIVAFTTRNSHPPRRLIIFDLARIRVENRTAQILKRLK